MSNKREKPLVYDTIHNYVVAGEPIPRDSFLEFSEDARPLLTAIGKSGIDLANPGVRERFVRLWKYMEQHTKPAVNTAATGKGQFKKLHG